MCTVKKEELEIFKQEQEKLGASQAALGVETACQCERLMRHRFNSWVRMIPWRMVWQPIPVFLRGGSHRQRHLVVYGPWDCNESYTTEAT